MSGRVVTAAVCAALAAGSAATASRADDAQVQLPQPYVALTGEPPLTSNAVVYGETRVPGSISSTQSIRVGVGPAGRPVSVSVVQRLRLHATGDYTFFVPAPALDVLPGPGTQSEPGFRQGAILWQGFSPGERTLSALAKLQLAQAAKALPLRLALAATVGGVELTGGALSGPLDLRLAVDDRTATVVSTFGGRGDVGEVAETLDTMRTSLRTGAPLPAGVVTLHGNVTKARVRVAAAFDVTGQLTFARGGLSAVRVEGGRVVRPGAAIVVRFAGRLDGKRSLRLRLTGSATRLEPPKLEVHATPVLDVEGLRPPRGGTWRRALREGLVHTDERRFLATGVATFLRLARTNQYLSFLLNPDISAGLLRNRASYAFVTAEAAPVRPPPLTGSDSGLGAAALTAIAAGSVLAAGGLIVLWAHQ